MKRVVDDCGAQDARRFDGVGGQGGGIERCAEKFPPVATVVVVEGELFCAAPDLDLLEESDALGRGVVAEFSASVRPVEAVDAEVHAFVDPGADIPSGGIGARE